MDINTILLTAAVSIFVIILLYIGYVIGVKLGESRARSQFKHQEAQIRKDAVNRSRATLSGQFSEQLAPYLPGFPYSPTEVRFIGKPVDFIVFRGLDGKDIEEVFFVEVKSGASSLSQVEKKLKQVIDAKKVSWQEYRIFGK